LDWRLTISACCILHNTSILIDNKGWDINDAFNRGFTCEDGAFKDDPADATNNDPRPGTPDSAKAKRYRDVLAEKLSRRTR
jgi:hypothetical protein